MTPNEMQAEKTEINVSSLEEEVPEYMKVTKPQKQELNSFAKQEDLTANQNQLDPRFVVVILLISGVFLFVVAIYYGIINP